MKENLLSINKFEQPKEVEGKQAIYVLLKRLLLLDPGSIEAFPEMGVGIVSKWRYSFFDNLDLLKETIQEQISTYLPQFQGVEVKLSGTKDKEVIIEIIIDNTLYKFKTENNTIRLQNL